MNSFNIHTVKRNIGRYGTNITFRRPVKNRFGEDTSETVDIHRLRGIFHNTSSGWKSVSHSDETEVRKKPQPMIMTMFSDTALLRQGDLCTIGNKDFRLLAVDDVDCAGEVAEISLEAIV